MLLGWSSSVPQPAVIRSLGKSREGPGTAMKSPAGSAERTRSNKRPSGGEGAQTLKAFPSLGGVLERGGFLAARLVEDLRLVLIRVARGLDGSLGVSHQLADHYNEALTLSRMLVGVQDQGGLSQGAQIAHDLGIGALPQLGLARDRLFEFEGGDAAVGQGRAIEHEGACDNVQNRKGFHEELPSFDPDRCGRIVGRA